MKLKPGINLILKNEGEGWFPLASATGIYATVLHVIESTTSDMPFYIVQLHPPLKIQEKAKTMPSTLQLMTYEHAIVKSRWNDIAIGAEPQVSAYFLLPPPNAALPDSEATCMSLEVRACVLCTIIA